MGIRDLLPQSPRDGPPIPRFMKEEYYIQSLPPGDYLYHHSYYSGLKRIVHEGGLRADPRKRVISLTTDPGRFLSPLPFLMAVTVDGVVRIPYTSEVSQLAIPALYSTRNSTLVTEVQDRGYKVFLGKDLPPEYRYIRQYVTHRDMFIDENEYAILMDYFSLPSGSVFFIDPRKIKRFKGSLPPYVEGIWEIRPLTELVEGK